MGTCVSRAAPLGDASFPAASATGASIAAFSREAPSGGMMVGAEVGRMTSRPGGSRDPKYGRQMDDAAIDEFLKLERRASDLVAVRNRTKCVAATRGWSARVVRDLTENGRRQ